MKRMDGLEENWTMMKYMSSGLMGRIQHIESIQEVQEMFLHIAFEEKTKAGTGEAAVDIILLSVGFQSTK